MRTHLLLRSHLSELERLADAITQLGVAQELPDKVVSDLNLALEEVVSNIIRHGYKGREDREVSIAIHLTPETIAVTVEDDGVPFNPLQLPDPDLTIPLEERRVGGLGVYLVRKLMDEVHYHAEGGRNVLGLTKRIAPLGTGMETARTDE